MKTVEEEDEDGDMEMTDTDTDMPMPKQLIPKMSKNILLLVMVIWIGSKAWARHPAAEILEKVSKKLNLPTHVTNVGLGTISRSMIISASSQLLRGEDHETVKETLDMAIVTLAVRDIGGGVLVPTVQAIADHMSKRATFRATRTAWRNYNEQIRIALTNQLDDLSNDNDVKRLLNQLKRKQSDVYDAFANDVRSALVTHPHLESLKQLNRAKHYLKVKHIVDVLGPIFDIVGVSLDINTIVQEAKTCNTKGMPCNYPGIVSASLGIASGLFGIGSFCAALLPASSALGAFGPIGAVVGLVFAIGATLVELFWKLPPATDPSAIQRAEKFEMMMALDTYSRQQLFTAHTFFLNHDFTRFDTYVVNQGQLPNWNDLDLKIEFGTKNLGDREKKVFNMKCEEPKQLGTANSNSFCSYLVEGRKTMLIEDNYKLGFPFYGLTRNEQSTKNPGEQSIPDQAYGGSIVMVNTDAVQKHSHLNVDRNIVVKGINIRVDQKTTRDLPYIDIINIGKMKNINENEKIVVKTGRGNDALGIDGMLGDYTSDFENILDADLGADGYNTLSFFGMSQSSDVKMIEYDANTEELKFCNKTDEFGDCVNEHNVGKVANVGSVLGSPFQDRITLGAKRTGQNGIDFSVLKYKGISQYFININELAGQSRTRHFKIVDSTTGIPGSAEACGNYNPELEILNFDMRAQKNDIIYKDGKIQIFGRRRPQRQGKSKNEENKQNFFTSKRTGCSGGDGKGGGSTKALLATVVAHTKCPLQIMSSTQSGSCMAPRTIINELDVIFYSGRKLTTQFDGDRGGTDKDDLMYLLCPLQEVTKKTEIDLGAGQNDAIVLRNSFINDCKIDSKSHRMQLQKINDTMPWQLVFVNVPKFPQENQKSESWIHSLRGVEKILNDYGETVVDLTELLARRINLFDDYNKVTMKKAGFDLGSQRTPEIQRKLLQCINNPSDEKCEDSTNK
eukprot:gene8291-9174_t